MFRKRSGSENNTTLTNPSHMKKILFLIFIPFGFFELRAQEISKTFPEAFTVKVTNPSTVAKQNSLVVLSPEFIRKKSSKFNSKAFVVLQGKDEIPSQYNSVDQVTPGVVYVIPELKAGETKVFTIRFAKKGTITRSYTKKTQAELSHRVGGRWEKREYKGGQFKNVQELHVPAEHKDHSWFIRYEGPGWESDLVGYRFYLDQRNATDVFGKKTPDMVLQNVGQDGFDSYHEMQPWGMDVMKVGKSLGIGSIGYMKDGKVNRVEKTDSVYCKIKENGPVYSSILTNYYGWNTGDGKATLGSSISIHAGTRLTHQHITIDGPIQELVSGIVKDTLATMWNSRGDGQSFGYIATYGKQSLNNDNLGLALLFRPTQLISFTEDDQSHVVRLRAEEKKVEYYFLATWEKETNGIKNEAEFRQYLAQVAKDLASPLRVE
jgi:hypothetical protein